MFFKEEKARQVINYLLEDDIKIYRQFIPIIKDFNKDQLDNLFNGVEQYDYKITMHHHFKLLLSKFNNYEKILNEWYDNDENYKYLKELWLKNISLESLVEKSPSEIEKYLENLGVYINKWPTSKKEKFFDNLRNSKNTIYNKIKKFFTSIPSKLKYLIKLMKSLSTECEKNGITDIAINLINYISSIVMTYTNCPQKDIYKNMCQDFISKISSESSFADGIRHIKQKLPSYTETLKSIYDKTGTKLLYSLTSLYNLGNSIINYKCINDIMKEIDNKDYQKLIKDLGDKFREDRKKLNNDLNSCDISQFDAILKDGVNKIEEHEKALKKIIEELNKYINDVENKKTRQICNLITGIVQFGTGIIGGIVTSGATSALYFASSGANAISAIFSGINIDKLKDLNKKLLSYKENAKILQKEIRQELLELNSRLKDAQEAAPIYF